MKYICLLLVSVMVVSLAFGATTRKPDEICKNADTYGIIEIGCWGYKDCVGGVYAEHHCEDRYVLDKNTRTCHLKGTQNTSCDYEIDCSVMPDAFYAHYADKCASYSQCYGGTNIAAFYCPGNTIFNEEIQGCDFSSNVLPPCGFKIPQTTTPAAAVAEAAKAKV